MRTLGWIVVLLVTVAAALTLDPERIGVVVPGWAGLTTTFPVAQLIALRMLLAGIFGVLAVILLIVGLVRKIGFHGGTHSLVLALALALVAAGHFGFLWTRGINNPDDLGPDRGLRPSDPGDGAVTVLAYNTQIGQSDAEDIAAVAEETGADVLALTETGPQLADQIAAFLAGGGETFQVFSAADEGAAGEDDAADEEQAAGAGPGATALLVSTTLGEYVQVDGPATAFASIQAEPASGVGPVLVATHVTPPVEDRIDTWRADLELVAELCGRDGPDGLVLAGDLNATLDHAPLQDLDRCVDAGVESGVGGVATWPSSLPALVGSPIDHVLVDAEAFEVVQGRVVEAGQSDHRGLVVRVRPLD